MTNLAKKRWAPACLVAMTFALGGCPEEGPCVNAVDCSAGETCAEGRCVVAPDEEAAVIRSFEASSLSVQAGASVTLTWEVDFASACSLRFDDVTVDVECDSSRDFVVERSTDFLLLGVGAGGNAQRVVRVEVGAAFDGGFDAGAAVDGGAVLDGGLDAGAVVDGGLDAGAVVDGGVDAGGVVDGGFDGGVPAIVSVGKGAFHTCVVFDDGRMKCFGRNDLGQLGLGDTEDRGDEPGEMGSALPFVDLGGPVASVDCGVLENCCAVLQDQRVKCWGSNEYGQLGIGNTVPHGNGEGGMGGDLPAVDLGLPAVEVQVGRSFGCARLSDNTLKCWGNNFAGQLGNESTENIGDEPGEIGESVTSVNLPGVLVDFTVGGTHSCARLSTGETHCWGYGYVGALGSGATANVGDSPDSMGIHLPALDVGFDVVQVAAGDHHTCVANLAGQIKCFGLAGVGGAVLGNAQVGALGDEPNEMGVALPFVNLPAPAANLYAGPNRTFFTTEQGILFGWGVNIYGELGLTGGSRGDSLDEMGNNLPPVPLNFAIANVFPGGETTCVVNEEGKRLYCFGRGEHGALGTGNEEDVGRLVGEIQNLEPVPLF